MRVLRLLYELRSIAAEVVRRKYRRLAAEMLRAAEDCRGTQATTHARLMRLNDGSEFSAAHHIHAETNAEEFRRQVPIADYEYFRAYIDRMKDGNQRALLGEQNRLLMFCLSSGTTAESKFIPVTNQFLDDYRRGWQAWGIIAFDAHPGAHRKQIVQMTSDYDRYRTSAGIPCGNISGFASSTQKATVRSMYSVPYLVAKIPDAESKYYAALRFAVAEPHVGVMTTANPSTVIHLAQLADAEKESLIRDIADGTLSPRYPVPENVSQGLKRAIARKSKRRARQLEAIVERTGHLYPKDFWPGLELMAVWVGGSCAAYVDRLRNYYGDLPIRDHGLSASEGRMTIPIRDDCSEGILDIQSHYFEFIPEAEYGSSNATVLEAHELSIDENYYILLTTTSGLYRYDICDVVRCTDFHGTTPILRFLNKGAHISNITGEKLTESQVVDAVSQSARTHGISLSQFTLLPSWGDPPKYQLLVEQSDLETDDQPESLAAAADAELQQLNCEYEEKRQSDRLAPLEVITLPDGAWQRFAKERQSGLGGSVEQYKHPCLIPDLERAKLLLDEISRGSVSPQAVATEAGNADSHPD